jgi:hypothetical protein
MKLFILTILALGAIIYTTASAANSNVPPLPSHEEFLKGLGATSEKIRDIKKISNEIRKTTTVKKQKKMARKQPAKVNQFVPQNLTIKSLKFSLNGNNYAIPSLMSALVATQLITADGYLYQVTGIAKKDLKLRFLSKYADDNEIETIVNSGVLLAEKI